MGMSSAIYAEFCAEDDDQADEMLVGVDIV